MRLKRILSCGGGRWLVVAMVSATLCFFLAAFPGCGKGEPTLEEIWEKSAEAQENVASLHMEIAIFYQNTKFGSGQIQTYTVDVSGNNVHLQNSIFGHTFSEVIVVGGKQYSRAMGQKEWQEQPVSLTAQSATEQVRGLANLPSVASTKENKGLEKVGGKEAYHLYFGLAPGEIPNLFSKVPVSQLSAASGADVDVWVEKDTYYRIKYEAVIRNVLIEEKIGYGDVRIVTNITEINQPISISPPS
ncbi:hypothetical protein [Candidatus Solincola sp.]|nr:hypothetical protein [Actinomycetota bacterium]